MIGLPMKPPGKLDMITHTCNLIAQESKQGDQPFSSSLTPTPQVASLPTCLPLCVSPSVSL